MGMGDGDDDYLRQSTLEYLDFVVNLLPLLRRIVVGVLRLLLQVQIHSMRLELQLPPRTRHWKN